MKCERYHRNGHYIDNCVAGKTLGGNPIKEYDTWDIDYDREQKQEKKTINNKDYLRLWMLPSCVSDPTTLCGRYGYCILERD